MLTNEEEIFSSFYDEIEASSDEEIEVVSSPDADPDNILSFNLRRGAVNSVIFPMDR